MRGDGRILHRHGSAEVHLYGEEAKKGRGQHVNGKAQVWNEMKDRDTGQHDRSNSTSVALQKHDTTRC